MAQYENRETIAPVLPTFSSMRSSLYRKRRERLPPLPRSVEDLNFEGEWSKTLNGEDFMLGSRDGVFMFSDLSSSVLPGIHITCLQARAAVSTGVLFVPGKNREAYNTSFIFLKEAAQNIGLEVDHQR